MAKRIQAPADEGAGIAFPRRLSDCTGKRPSWYPFQINVCDQDEPDIDPLPTDRHRELPPAPTLPDWHP